MAVQRGGMKVCVIPMDYVPKHIAHAVYGYATFDKYLDLEMQKAEGIEHYNFNFKKSVSQAVKRKIADELQLFGREKLGIGVTPEERRRRVQSEAEREAVYAVNRILKKMGFTSKNIGPPPNGGNGNSNPKKPLRLEIEDFDFPRKIRRVNYGEVLGGAKLQAFNKTRQKATVNIKTWLVQGNKQIGKHLYNRDVELNAGQSMELMPLDLEITKENFPLKGRYAVRARMLAVQVHGSKKGAEIHKAGKIFYVEEDPPESGLFEKCDGMPYGDVEEMKTIMGEAVPGEDQGYIFQYNTDHSAYEEYSEKEEELKDYLVRIMADEIPRIVIRADKQKIFTEEEISDPEKLTRKASQLQGQVLYDYFNA